MCTGVCLNFVSTLWPVCLLMQQTCTHSCTQSAWQCRVVNPSFPQYMLGILLLLQMPMLRSHGLRTQADSASLNPRLTRRSLFSSFLCPCYGVFHPHSQYDPGLKGPDDPFFREAFVDMYAGESLMVRAAGMRIFLVVCACACV